jgi:uracil-DNA glycosylase family 4
MTIVVPPSGPQPSPWMVLGERPGVVEARTGYPFSGPSGEEHRRYLHLFGLDPRAFRLDNCARDYVEGNDDPTPADLARWTPHIESEIRATGPRCILAAGGYATRWLLGPCDLEAVTGFPHPGGAFDPSIAHRACGAIVVPIFHPARGLHDDGFRPLVSSRYEMAAEVVKRVAKGLPVQFPRDGYVGREKYRDVSGGELASILRQARPDVLGLDTEGHPWSVQISLEPGTGYMVRCSRDDFQLAIQALQELVDGGCLFCVHQASGPDYSFHDMVVCRAMGLELRYARLFDTMYAAYLRRTEPQGLKALSYRKAGMRMTDYESLLGGIGRDRQIEYLVGVMGRKWPRPDPTMVRDGDGEYRLYSPEAPHQAAKRILMDVWNGKVNKEGEPTDPYKRWKNLDRSVRAMVEAEDGRMPAATLDDVLPDAATHYGCSDSDGTLRDYYALAPELERHGLAPLMDHGMSVMGFFEEMQERGMPGSYARFLALRERLIGELDSLQWALRNKYFGGRPYNPNSPIDVPVLMAERGLLTGRVKRSRKSGRVSTSKKHIGHLKFVDEAMYDTFQYRERHKLVGTFVGPIIEGMERRGAGSVGTAGTTTDDVCPVGVDRDDAYPVLPVRTNMKITRVATRRPASSKSKSGGEEVNLLNIPKRTKHGKAVRACYVAPPGHVFVRADWSQCQMRIMADECGDPLLIKLYQENRDVYVETAARAESKSRGVEVPTSAITDDTRQAFKTACLGTIFGLQALGLRDQLWGMGEQYRAWSEDDCQGLLDSILVTYPGIPRYFDAVARELRGSRGQPNPHGEIRSRWGMPRYLPGIHSLDRKVSAASIREAVNHKVQDGESGMMYNVIEWLRPVVRSWQDVGVEVVPRLEIYDSLDFTVPEWFADTWKEILLDAMLNHTGVELAVPIKADVSSAVNWADL